MYIYTYTYIQKQAMKNCYDLRYAQSYIHDAHEAFDSALDQKLNSSDVYVCVCVCVCICVCVGNTHHAPMSHTISYDTHVHTHLTNHFLLRCATTHLACEQPHPHSPQHRSIVH